MFSTKNSLRLWIQKIISPKKFCKRLPFNTKSFLKHPGKSVNSKCPTIQSRGKHYISLFRSKINIFIFFFFKLFLCDVFFSSFSPFQVFCHSISCEKGSHYCVYLLEKFHQVTVAFEGSEFQFGY